MRRCCEEGNDGSLRWSHISVSRIAVELTLPWVLLDSARAILPPLVYAVDRLWEGQRCVATVFPKYAPLLLPAYLLIIMTIQQDGPRVAHEGVRHRT